MTEPAVNSFLLNVIGTVFTDTLWQGIIIGISLLVGLSFLKSDDAKSRYNLAAAAGLEEARKAREKLSTRMIPAQVAEGQSMSREWPPQKGKERSNK